MSLTGWPLVGVAVLAVVLSPFGTVALWNRVHGGPAVRLVQRLVMVGLCQVVAVALTAVLVNDEFSLYDSWTDVFGQNPAAGAPVPDPGEGPGGGRLGVGGVPTSLPPGRLVSEEITGPQSRIRAKVWILLPDGYDAPANRTRRYPAVEFLPGYPGTPTTWLHAMQLQQTEDAGVASGQIQPFIAVLPTMNVAMPRDTECTNIPGNLQVATWLGEDVPRVVSDQVRAFPVGRGWGVSGYSTGGFCAAKLLLKFPTTFSAGAVLAGYFTAGTDASTGDLFGGSQAVRDTNDPTWLITHHTPPPVHLLVVYSTKDRVTAGPTQRFLAVVRPPLSVDELRLTEGGHNTGVWLSVEPKVLAWLSQHLAATGVP